MSSPIDNFYPTPPGLISRLLSGVNFELSMSVLEPSAGKGDIADTINSRIRSLQYGSTITPDIDTIEINPDLQHILKGKGYPVIHNDFLTFRTYKHYDLIAMNPPFADGEKHLFKAIELQSRTGGGIACVLNAETVRNPSTNLQHELATTLNRLGAKISYLEGAFNQAERRTNVEVALVQIWIPPVEHKSLILDALQRGPTLREINAECTALNVNKYVTAVVRNFEEEIRIGLQLIRDYKAIKPLILGSITSRTSSPILELTISGTHNLSENLFIQRTRMKYWATLFENPKFTEKFTSNLLNQFQHDMKQLQNYDFNEYNINQIRLEMTGNMIQATEDTIVSLFDKMTNEYHWHPETSKNRHYFNGWSTNKAWKINTKVILPLNLYGNLARNTSIWSGREPVDTLIDIDKTLRYLAGNKSASGPNARDIIDAASKQGQTKNIEFEFFTITSYKKGTTHITFTDTKLLKRLNIFGCQHKGWLPPGYGKKAYGDLEPEEQVVVNDYEGETSYRDTLRNRQYYLAADTNVYPALAEPTPITEA